MIYTADIIAEIHAIDRARQAVRPYVGDLPMACDSAESVYLNALASLGHDIRELRRHPGTATAVWPALKRQRPATKRVAMDSKTLSDRATMFPNGNRIRAAV